MDFLIGFIIIFVLLLGLNEYLIFEAPFWATIITVIIVGIISITFNGFSKIKRKMKSFTGVAIALFIIIELEKLYEELFGLSTIHAVIGTGLCVITAVFLPTIINDYDLKKELAAYNRKKEKVINKLDEKLQIGSINENYIESLNEDKTYIYDKNLNVKISEPDVLWFDNNEKEEAILKIINKLSDKYIIII